jgi:hypothetical protein
MAVALLLMVEASLSVYFRVFFGCLVQAIYFGGWIANRAVLQYRLNPRKVGIFVEVGAVENHQVDIFADVAFGSDAVSSGALGAVLDGFAEFGFTEGLGLSGEDFLKMHDYALFEGF